MNYRFTKSLALLVVATAAFASVQDGVLLRRVLKADSKETYKLESVTKISADTPAGAQEGSATSLGTIETKTGALKGDGNSADYTIVTNTDQLKMDGMMGQMPTPDKVPPVTVQGVIDNLNRMTGAKVVGKEAAANPMQMLGGSEAQQMGLFVQFPDKSVKEGDTWSITLPPSAMMGKDPQTLTAKFVGSRDLNGQKVYVVTLSGTLKIEPDMEAMKKAQSGGAADPTMGMDIKVKGTANLESENLIDPATGVTVQANTHVKGQTDVEIVQMAMTTKVTTDTTIKMTLNK